MSIVWIKEHKRYIHPDSDMECLSDLKRTTYSISYGSQEFGNFLLVELEEIHKTLGQFLNEKGGEQ